MMSERGTHRSFGQSPAGERDVETKIQIPVDELVIVLELLNEKLGVL